MSMKKATQLIGIMSLFLMGMMLLSQSADAAEEQTSLRWDIMGDFTNGESDVTLIVEIGSYGQEGEWNPTSTIETPLKCADEGVDFSNGTAVFNGEVYIACEMIDINELAVKLTGYDVDFPSEMGGSGTFVEAELSATEYGNNPIFYHPDIQFHALNAGETFLGLEVGGLKAMSSLFMPEIQQYVRGELGKSDDETIHYPEFVAGQEPLDSDPTVLHGDAPVSNVYGGLIYIGYSPDTDTYFEGEIYRIWVDPGCSGHGFD